MAAEPTNKRLFNMWVMRARAHFRTFPSPAASAWVHQHYVESGGRFVTTDASNHDASTQHVSKKQMKKVRAKNEDQHDPKDDEDRSKKERDEKDRPIHHKKKHW